MINSNHITYFVCYVIANISECRSGIQVTYPSYCNKVFVIFLVQRRKQLPDGNVSNVLYRTLLTLHVKVNIKVIPQQAEVAQGVPDRLRPRIFLTFGTTRVVCRQP